MPIFLLLRFDDRSPHLVLISIFLRQISDWYTLQWHSQLSFPKAAGASLATCFLRQTEGGAYNVEIPCEEL